MVGRDHDFEDFSSKLAWFFLLAHNRSFYPACDAKYVIPGGLGFRFLLVGGFFCFARVGLVVCFKEDRVMERRQQA